MITGFIPLNSEPNAAGGGAHLFHRVNRAEHIGATGGNYTRVRALDIGPKAIKGPITSLVLRLPQRTSSGRGKRDAGNQNLNLCYILMEDKVSKTRRAKFLDKR